MALKPLSPSHLAAMRALLAERDRLLGTAPVRDAPLETEARHGDGDDPGDAAQSLFEYELADGLSLLSRARLAQINGALQRLAAGHYGLCQECQQPIAPERLDALPWAPLCLECQRWIEHAAPHSSRPRSAGPARAAGDARMTDRS